MHTIYTIGYGAPGWTPAALKAELYRLGAVLWDIRYSPRSRRPGWNRDELRALLGAEHYTHEPALGNRNYAGDGPIELAAPARAVPRARGALLRWPVALLCGCVDAASCHRSVAAAYLARELGAAVVHLDPPTEPAPSGMKALTLTQPWASLVAIGAKQIETRGWATRYRGVLAIHAGKGLGEMSQGDFAQLCHSEPFKAALRGHFRTAGELPRGAIVAVCELVDCRRTAADVSQYGVHLPDADVIWQLTDRERAFGDYSPGRFGWLLNDVRRLPEPVPCRGYQQLWDVPPDVAAQVEAQLRAVTS